MQLEKSNLIEYLEALPHSGRKALFVFFPNFEERSVTAAQIVSQHPDIRRVSHGMVYRLQGVRPAEILDEVKRENAERVVQSCRTVWPELDTSQLAYPTFPFRHFQAAIRERIEALGPVADIIVDISATPRDLLFQLFEVLFPVDAMGSFRVGKIRIGSIYFIYSWAKNYPISSGPELLGDLTGYQNQKPLPELLRNKNRVRLTVCGAGTGHDALQAVTVADLMVHKTTLTSDVYFLLNRRNPLRSFDQMMRHQSLMNYAQRNGLQFTTVFSVDHFSAELTRIAGEAAADHAEGNCAFIVGPFGPKPLGLCAYFATKEYLRLCSIRGSNGNTADILDLNGAQYLTLYSLGVSDTDFYEVTTTTQERDPSSVSG